MSNVTKIGTKKSKPVPETVEALERMLQEAKDGKLVGIVYAGIFRDEDNMLSAWGLAGHMGKNTDMVVGALENAKCNYQHNFCFEWVPDE